MKYSLEYLYFVDCMIYIYTCYKIDLYNSYIYITYRFFYTVLVSTAASVVFLSPGNESSKRR